MSFCKVYIQVEFTIKISDFIRQIYFLSSGLNLFNVCFKKQNEVMKFPDYFLWFFQI